MIEIFNIFYGCSYYEYKLCPAPMINKFIDCVEEVSLEQVTKAQQLGYSQEIIHLLLQKGSAKSFQNNYRVLM